MKLGMTVLTVNAVAGTLVFNFVENTGMALGTLGNGKRFRGLNVLLNATRSYASVAGDSCFCRLFSKSFSGIHRHI